MKIFALTFSAGLLALISIAPSYAQGNAGGGSYHIRTDQLDHVKPYNAPRQIDVIDNRTIIHNHLEAEQGADSVDINVAFPQGQGGNHIPVQIGNPSNSGGGALPYRTGNPNLNSTKDLAPPSSMYNSNVPSRPVTTNRNLPQGQSTGIHGPTSAGEQKAVSGHLNPGSSTASGAVPAKTYQDYKKSSNGASNGGLYAETKATGRRITSPLKNRLLSE